MSVKNILGEGPKGVVFACWQYFCLPVLKFVFDVAVRLPVQSFHSFFKLGNRDVMTIATCVLSFLFYSCFALWLVTNLGGSAAFITLCLLVAGAAIFGLTTGVGRAGNPLVRGTQVQAATAPARAAKGALKPLQIGNVVVPPEVEGLHFLIAGSTGTGKSQAINSMLRTLRDRGDKVLVVDSGGESMASLFRPGDKLLNPLDSRSENWSVAAEMRSGYEASRVAEMMVPAESGGSSREWQLYSQSLISAVVQRLHERGELSNERLVYFLTVAKSDEIESLVSGLPAQTLMDSGAAKMLSSVRGIIGSYLPAYRFLKPETGSDGFSIRNWVQSDEAGWLWLPYRDDQLSSLRGLISCWLGEAVNSTLSLRPDPNRRIWIIADELASLGRIAGLADGLTKGRKYGLRVVAGLQSVSQLRAVFGKEESTTLLSCLSNILCLRAADGETADYFSKGFGQQEILRTESSESSQGSSSSSVKHVTQNTIMSSQISGLPQRIGYVRLASQPGTVFQTEIPICDLGLEVIPPFLSK